MLVEVLLKKQGHRGPRSLRADRRLVLSWLQSHTCLSWGLWVHAGPLYPLCRAYIGR